MAEYKYGTLYYVDSKGDLHTDNNTNMYASQIYLNENSSTTLQKKIESIIEDYLYYDKMDTSVSVGSNLKPIYLNNGVPTECSLGFSTYENQLMYIQNGQIKYSNASIGSPIKPVYPDGENGIKSFEKPWEACWYTLYHINTSPPYTDIYYSDLNKYIGVCKTISTIRLNRYKTLVGNATFSDAYNSDRNGNIIIKCKYRLILIITYEVTPYMDANTTVVCSIRADIGSDYYFQDTSDSIGGDTYEPFETNHHYIYNKLSSKTYAFNDILMLDNTMDALALGYNTLNLNFFINSCNATNGNIRCQIKKLSILAI